MSSGENTTSETLLERLRQPNQPAAWERFVGLYTPLLLYWARRSGLQLQDAAEFVQEVLVLLVEKLPEFQYDRQKSFRSWLRTLAQNRWRDRQRRRQPAARGGAERQVPDLTIADGLEDVWEQEHRQYLTRRALELMQSDFQPTSWKACWEHVVNGRSAAEVGAELGISENAVYIASCRVVRHLRRELAGLMD
jgi:RNA polymerase sigma-70 factor, ECF subfamily